MKHSSTAIYIAEFLGTFAIVFCGTGAIIINQETHGTISHAGIAITFGLVVMSMIYAFGEVSGAHLNPAVSIAFTIAGVFPLKKLLPYFVFQLLGGISASLLLKYLFPGNEMLGATIPAGPAMQSFILEFVLTFFLVVVIMSVARGSKEQGLFAGVAIGSVVALEAMFAGPICGASMNPARSIAPAVASGHYEFLWIYILATIAGACAGTGVWKLMSIK